jgi:hypothetical protein
MKNHYELQAIMNVRQELADAIGRDESLGVIAEIMQRLVTLYSCLEIGEL